MFELRIHGRGGQGAVTAAEVLAIAAFREGRFSQAFPKFGPERSGAPVEAFCRIDNKFISLRSFVYEPDYVIVLDESLLASIDIEAGLKKEGVIILNTKKKTNLNHKTFCINASKIALETVGKPFANIAILGAFAKITKLISLKSLEEAIQERFSKELAEKNILAARRVYDETQ